MNTCRMEKELQQAKEHLKLTGQLSKELASAQREIRELRRANDIQYILRRNYSKPAKLVSDSRIQPRLSASMNDEENVFSSLPDNVMLKLFSFLDEDSMVAISVTDKVLVRRVNVMFGRPASPPPRKTSKGRSLSFIGSSEKDKLSKVDAI
ncbi:uncharacterized protein PITG_21627 [Phytophthora infestans T30-4]|uniref:F-box domain-containing protein n=1 Tax=Phytophthora infestans (strain T30-4) TaxID=403677 RepID=D0P4P0_PHYIT|nr:uncharacterized protein PITG_21627 [Phytophthora infestans T30-4]EEY68634.1 conserved hypothetical protein [Phytophthora infestans T30-4]|eukprot:XP_002996911.1 conserved hypothetical protein [Phytophthora infestans T30-4]